MLISLCRHAGLPTRYVSGYLGSVGESTASHAWVEAFVPPYGWIGVDPTHGTLCTGAHVKVGVGRDYGDVSVLRGTYQGRGDAQLEVHVTSEAVSHSAAVTAVRSSTEPRSRPLVAFQNLGAMHQFRRGPLMHQSLGAMSQTLAVLEEPPPPRGQHRPEGDVPMQQPRQQQQGGGPCSCA